MKRHSFVLKHTVVESWWVSEKCTLPLPYPGSLPKCHNSHTGPAQSQRQRLDEGALSGWQAPQAGGRHPTHWATACFFPARTLAGRSRRIKPSCAAGKAHTPCLCQAAFFGQLTFLSCKRCYSSGNTWDYVFTQESYLYINYSNFTHVNKTVILWCDLLWSCNRKAPFPWHLGGNGTGNFML